MGVLKPRKRLVNFRLTQEEYERLAAVCAQKGAPSISDFARSAILRTVELESSPAGALNNRLAYLDQRLAQLEAGLRRLARAGDAERGASRRGPPPLAAARAMET
jgi:hypothetical protein